VVSAGVRVIVDPQGRPGSSDRCRDRGERHPGDGPLGWRPRHHVRPGGRDDDGGGEGRPCGSL